MTETSLMRFVETNFPCEDAEKLKHLQASDFKNKFENWKDFALALATYEARGEAHMTVLKSSSWAICQEFLQTPEADVSYSRGRGGVWGDRNLKISTRKVLDALVIQYPTV
jgi:hypothetical protein